MNTRPVSYLQTDPRWGSLDYSAKGEKTTIRASGCGPTAMAMALATWADPKITPKTECAWALAHGYRRLVMAGALGGRLDQTIASLQTLRGLTDAGAQGWLIGCGWVVTAVHNGTLTLPAEMAGTVSVFSSGDAARGVTLRGLLYEVTDEELTCAMPLGVSNSFTGVPATVRVTDGTVFVLWQGDALPDGLEVRHGAE